MTRIKIPANGKKVPLFGIINILTLFLVNFVSFYGPCYKVKYHGFQEQCRNEFFSLKFWIRKIFYVLYEHFLLQMNIYYEFYYEKLILFIIYLRINFFFIKKHLFKKRCYY